MCRIESRIPVALAVASMGWIAAPSAQAADLRDFESSERAWQFEVTPYVWMAGVHGEFELGDFPPITVDEPFTEILDNLNAVFMGRFEARSGRGGVIGDVVYVDSDYILNFDGFHIDFDDKLLFGTFAATYRPFEQTDWYVDLLAGARAWYFETDVVDRDENIDAVLWRDHWIDPIVGAQGRIDFTDRFYATAYGDIGGFGVGSELTWQAMASLGYRVHGHFDLSAGYRYLYFRRLSDDVLNEQNISGPTLAAIFTF